MSDETGNKPAKSVLRMMALRFGQNRWMLAAGIACLLAIRAWGSADHVVLVAIAVLFLVAAAAPSRTPAERRAEQQSAANTDALGGLSSEQLASAVADPLIVFDETGGVVHANEAAISVFGAMRPGMSLLLKFRTPEMQDLLQSVLSSRMPVCSADYMERVPVERAYRATATAVGKGTGLFVLAFKDQSEMRRIDRMRADFIANASHELRTPLASIAGFIETLRGPAREDAAARDHFLQIMQNQTGRMARLIDDLLSLSRLEMKSRLEPGAKVDLLAVLGNVMDSLAPVAADSGIVIERHFEEGAFQVSGARDELFQVFENLLENACKYGQSGGRVLVSVAGPQPGGEAEITATIRDFGPGIAEEDIPRVTERFYRVDAEASRAHKGTGLGLSIVKHILTRHNARLSIESKLGEGAAFTVHFPVD